MAMLFAHAPRMFVLKARRETVLLIVAAVAVTLTLAHGHKFGGSPAAPAAKPVAAIDGWTGNLAVAAPGETAPTEVLSSASLVVPKAQLALPAAPSKPIVRVKAACDSADKSCVARPGSAGVASKRQVAALDPRDHEAKSAASTSGLAIDRDAKDRPVPPEPIPAAVPADHDAKAGAAAQKSFFAGLNPLDHVPDLKTIGRPFAAAGDTVGGWIKRF